MEGIISHKCLGVRNVNLFDVGIEMLCHFFIFNITESSKMRVAVASLDPWEACSTAPVLAGLGHVLASGPISWDGGVPVEKPLAPGCESASVHRKSCGCWCVCVTGLLWLR